MAKQAEDKVTVELPLDAPAKRRGRPPKVGGAMSPAERKRAQRERDRLRADEDQRLAWVRANEAASRRVHLKLWSEEDLLEGIARYMVVGEFDQARMYWEELGDRRSWLPSA